MPSRPDCEQCPFRGDPETPCAAVLDDSPQWCYRTDRGKGIWTPTAMAELVRETYVRLGRPEPDEARVGAIVRRAGKSRVALGERPPARPGGR